MRVAVITGGHSFDVIGFHELWQSYADQDCYLQALEDWAVDYGRYGQRYDALVFYTMHKGRPEDCPGGRRTRAAVDALGDGTGIVVMHHGILGFKDDGVWDELVGLTGRTIGDGYSHDKRLAVHVEDPAHPVTEGISDWTMVDETYDFRDVDREGSEVLLTVDHPNSMSTMAWTRTYKESRVLNFVFGHDAQTWEDETFRRVLGNGVRWVGRQ